MYKYEASMTAFARDRSKVNVSNVFYYMNYGSLSSTLTPIPLAIGTYVSTKTGNYWIQYNTSGGIVNGGWNATQPFDMLLAPDGTNGGCGGVTLTRAHEIITTGEEF